MLTKQRSFMIAAMHMIFAVFDQMLGLNLIPVVTFPVQARGKTDGIGTEKILFIKPAFCKRLYLQRCLLFGNT
jgi:hypothetical protein